MIVATSFTVVPSSTSIVLKQDVNCVMGNTKYDNKVKIHKIIWHIQNKYITLQEMNDAAAV